MLTCVTHTGFFYRAPACVGHVLTAARWQVGFSSSQSPSRSGEAQQLPWQHRRNEEDPATISFLTSLPQTHKLTPTSSNTRRPFTCNPGSPNKRSHNIQKTIQCQSCEDLPNTPTSWQKKLTHSHGLSHPPLLICPLRPHIPAYSVLLSSNVVCIC